MSTAEVQPRTARRVARGSSGRPRKENTRSDRLVMACFPEDLRDLKAVSEAWNMPMSTLGWAVMHEWLQRGRGLAAEYGEARGPMRLLLEMALADGELGPWLRRQIAELAR